MTTKLKVLPFLLLLLVASWTLPQELQAQQTDCAFTRTFTGDLTAVSSSNLSANTPCVNWRVTVSTTGTLSSTVTFQTSPDNTNWTSVPNTPCTGAGTNCVYQGANPIVGTQGMVSVSAYGSYVRVVTSSSTGTGTGTVRGYGAKGITASYITPGTTGTVTNVTWTGGIVSIANPTTAPAFTIAGTSGGIVYFSSASTWASSGALTANYAILGGGAGNPPVSSTIFNEVGGHDLINTTVDLGAMFVVRDTRSTQPRGIVSWQTSTDTNGARFGCFKARGTDIAPSTVVTGDMGCRLNSWFYDGTNYLEMASIQVKAVGTIGTGRVPTSMTFSTATDAATSVLTDWGVLDQNGLMTYTLNAIGVTPQDSILLTNTTPAQVNAQQISPAVHWSGRGWETTGPSSQSVDFRSYVLPVQGTTSLGGTWILESSTNGAAYVQRLNISANALITLGGTTSISGRITANGFVPSNSSVLTNGMYLPAANTLGFSTNSGLRVSIDAVGQVAIGGVTAAYSLDVSKGVGLTGTARFFDQTATTGTTLVTITPGAAQTAASVTLANGGSETIAGTLAVSGSKTTSPSFQSLGTTYTLSTNTCSGTSLVGGATAGTFVSGTTGTCTVVVTMGSSATAPTGWQCTATDRTTPADLIGQTASSATTATLSGTTLASDVISFSCIGY